ncbi:MAG: hypothetical protein AAGK78_12935, partial [Planctomycetota bacterium]
AVIVDTELNGFGASILDFPGGTVSFNTVVVNLDIDLADGAIVNVTNGMTLNATATVRGTNSATGFQFVNSQTLTGTGEVYFEPNENPVTNEPRLLPFNNTTLTVGSDITVRGGNATLGNFFGGLIFNGTLIADSNEDVLFIGGSPWSASQALRTSNGGRIQLYGTFNNSGGPVELDAVGTGLSVPNSVILRDATLNGTAGTEVQFPSGTTTLDNVVLNTATRHLDGAISNVTNGLTANNTATIEAPSRATGLQFNGNQSLIGSGNFVFDSAGNAVITEPRLLPFNNTTLTIGAGITIEGTRGTVGNGFGGLVMNGTVDANVSGEQILIAGGWSGTGTLAANNGGEIVLSGTLDNAGATFNLDTGGGELTINNGTSLRNATLVGASGTNMTFNGGSSTSLVNMVVDTDMTMVNGC